MTMTGRAAFNVRHHAHGRGVASTHNAGNRSDRRGLLREAMRDLDAGAADFFASQNASIVREETHLNVAAVNDGAGGFRRPDSIDEVLDYGDARSAKVKRKLQPTQSTISSFVVFLPRTMCEEIPRFYDGDPPRSRMVARDRDEAIQYFRDVVDFLGDEVLTGGQAAIHGYDINFDETTPHIQVLADNFGPDGKGNLRTDFSRIWTRHRDVTDDAGRVLSGPEKLRGYQEGLREKMRELGYDVELEASDRSTESLSKEKFALEESKRRWRVQEKDVKSNLIKAIREVEADQKKVADDMEALPALRQKAVEEGHKKGYTAGYKKGREAAREAAREEVQTERTEIISTARKTADFLKEEAERKAQEKLDAAEQEVEEKLETAEQEAQALIDAAEREMGEIVAETRAAAADLENRMSALVFDVAAKLPPPAGHKGKNTYEVIRDKVDALVEKELPGATRFGREARLRETIPERAARVQKARKEAMGAVNEESQSQSQSRPHGHSGGLGA